MLWVNGSTVSTIKMRMKEAETKAPRKKNGNILIRQFMFLSGERLELRTEFE